MPDVGRTVVKKINSRIVLASSVTLIREQMRIKGLKEAVGLEMLSLERCRKVLGSDTKLSDESLAKLRDQFYCLASLALELRDHQKKSALERRDSGLVDRDALEERAAIIEFEGNVSRDEAERIAVALALENDHLN